MKKILSCAAAIILALALCVAALGEAEAGTDLPDMKRFNARTLMGGDYTEEALAEVDLTVVNVWSITCGPCIREMPELAAFGRALPENVRLIAICPDAYLAEDEVKSFLEQVGFEGDTLIYGDGDYMALLSKVLYTPTTFFLDSEGNLVGQVLIGSPVDLFETYLQAVNGALTDIEKPVITLEATD